LTKLNLKKLFLILFFSICIGAIYNFISADGLTFMIQRTQLVFDDAKVGNSGFIKAVKLDKALSLYQSGVKFVDARDKWDFSDGHIKGAINIPEYNLDENKKSLNNLNRNDTFVVYCGGDDCDTSKRLTEKLIKEGFTDVFVYSGGWEEWKTSGLPTENSEIQK
jgi:rhodanese-related sulfurtransferase